MSTKPFVDNPVARESMRELAGLYKLGFLFNPGGGAFTHSIGNCQITTCDDDQDLETLRGWIARNSDQLTTRNGRRHGLSERW